MKNLLQSVLPAKAYIYLTSSRRFIRNIGSYEISNYTLPLTGTEISFVSPKGHPWYRTIPELPLVIEMERELGPESVFYDIGAHFGFFSVVATCLGAPPHNIHSFEAYPYHYYVLKKNVSHPSSHTFRAFVGDANSEINLDNYSNHHSKPTHVKIDVEGAEVEVIQGMKDLLGTHKPTLYIEIHPKEIRNLGYHTNDLLDQLTEYGYEFQAAKHKITHELQENIWRPIADDLFKQDGDIMIKAYYPKSNN